jgi:hypothetical protein
MIMCIPCSFIGEKLSPVDTNEHRPLMEKAIFLQTI